MFTLFPSLCPNLKFESVSVWPYHWEASASKNSKERLKFKVIVELNTEDYIYFCSYYLYPFKLLLRMSHWYLCVFQIYNFHLLLIQNLLVVTEDTLCRDNGTFIPNRSSTKSSRLGIVWIFYSCVNDCECIQKSYSGHLADCCIDIFHDI